jgi:hypothetical protein
VGLWQSGPGAATAYLGGWEGEFSRSDLYALSSADLTVAYKWSSPWNDTELPTAALIMDKDRTGNGSATPDLWETLGVGPVYAKTGDYTLHAVGWYSAPGIPVTLMERDNATKQVNAISLGAFGGKPGGRDCSGPLAYSGEINQKNGYVYAIMTTAVDELIGADATTEEGLRLSIFRVAKDAGGKRTLTCLASNGGTTTALNDTIYGAWDKQFGKPPFPRTEYWYIGSDMAIDANGNAYVFARNADDRHVLLRINVPATVAGEPDPMGKYTYQVVKFFTGKSSNASNYGMAFMNGKMYVQESIASSPVWRYDPLSGAIENLGGKGDPPGYPKDLASAQMAPLIDGTVFNDANANSRRDNGEGGAGNIPVEIWQKTGASGTSQWALKGTLTTDGSGGYSAMLPAAEGEFLVRLRRPQINGVNAAQTYASAGEFRFADNPVNALRPYCFTQDGDYQAQAKSGPCFGARADGVDPPNVADPLAASGGAGIVSHVVMRSDLAVVTADFGITTTGSWGDAPASYKTTNAQQGPYANARLGSDRYLYLGAAAGAYADGQPSALADAHATDDGLEMAPVVAGETDADRSWAPAQGQIMVSGGRYRFRAKASGLADAVKNAHVKAWITSLTEGGVAASAMDRPLLGAGGGCDDAPDAEGYVYCDYQADQGAPKGSVTPLFARLRVGPDTGFTATSHGPVDGAKDAWAPQGEIEDYALGLAGGVLRVQARTLGGNAANANLALANVAGAGPSSAQDRILTNASGTFEVSRTGHALTSRTAPVVLDTTGVGAASAAGMNGWRLSAGVQAGKPVDTWCYDSATQTDLGAAVDQAAAKVTVPVPAAGRLPADITCQLTYAPAVDFAVSTVTADPSGNSASADRLTIPDGNAAVVVALKGVVQDQAGAAVTVPVGGAEVALALAPRAGTGATQAGARFQYSENDAATWQDAGQSHTCVVGQDGACDTPVRVIASVRGGYDLTANVDGAYLDNAATGEPTATSPVDVWFKEGAAASGQIDLADTADRTANYGVAGAGQGDFYVLGIQVADAAGNGVTGLTDADFAKTCAAGADSAPGTTCPAEVGVVFGAVAEDKADGREGRYTVAVYSTKSGPKSLGVWVSGVNGALPSRQDPNRRHVTATFLPMASIDPATSTFDVTSTGVRFASAANGAAANTYHEGVVTLRDANGNPITGALAAGKLAWAELAPPPNRVEFAEDTASGQAGLYQVRIWSDQAAAYSGKRVSFAQADSSLAYLAEPQTFEFAPPGPSTSGSGMSITADADQPANHDAPGSQPASWGRQTVTVTLRDAEGRPYEDAIGRLAASSPDAKVYFAAPAGSAGQFGCAAAPVGGRCPDGVYALEVYSGRAGSKTVSVTYTGADGAKQTIAEEGTGNDHVTAVFATPPPDPDWSVFVLGDPTLYPEETEGFDNWNDPADEPDGGDSISHDTGVAFHPGVRVWDAGRNNPVAGAEVRLTLSQPCAAEFVHSTADPADPANQIILRTSGDGKAPAEVNSAADSRCVIVAEIMAGGQWRPVKGSPKVLTWKDTEIDANASSFTVSSEEVVANGRDTGVITATLIGDNANPITTAGAALVASGPVGAGVKISAFTPDPAVNGRYTADFTGLKAGRQQIVVEAGGAFLPLAPDGNRYANLVAGPPVAAESWLVQPSGSAPADGVATRPVMVRAFDEQGNPAAGGSAVFAIPAGTSAVNPASGGVTVTGPGAVTAPIADGQARIDLAATVAAVHKVSATVAGEPVETVKNAAEDTTLRVDGQAEVTFTPGPPDPAMSELSIPTAGVDGLAAKEVGGVEKHTAQVQVRDAQGNAIVDGSSQVVFRWEHTDLAGRLVTGSTAAVAADGQGVASYDFGSTVATTWTVWARVEGTAADAAGSPKQARFSPGPVDRWATLGSFTVDSTVKRADGVANAAAQLTAQDQYGNPVEGADLKFALVYDGNQGPAFGDALGGAKEAAAKSGPDGVARAFVYSVWPGDFDVRGVWQTSQSAVRQVHFSNLSADPDKSRFRVERSQSNVGQPAFADGSDAYVVTVSLRDANNVPVNNAGAQVGFSPRNIPGAAPVFYPVRSGSAGRGQATVDLRTLKAGVWDVTVAIGNNRLGTESDPGVKSVAVTFLPGPAAVGPGASRLVAPVAPAKADGRETQVVRAEIADANGNPVGGEVVEFAIPADVSAVTGDGRQVPGPARVVVDSGAGGADLGVAELTLVSTKTGAYAVTARLAAQAIGDGSPALAVFVNADLDPGRSELTIPTAGQVKTVAVEFHTAQATLRDVSGNLYTPAVLVSFYYRLAGASVWSAGPIVESVDGVADWTDFTVDRAGAYEVRADVAAGRIAEAVPARQARFKAGPASAANSSFSASVGVVVANDVDTHSATVQVRDALGNPVAGEAVSFGLSGDTAAHFAGAGCGARTCAVTTSATGSASVRIASGEDTTTHVQAVINQADRIGEADLIFAKSAADPSRSSWSIAPAGPLVADGQASFTATVLVLNVDGQVKEGVEVGIAAPPAVTVSPAGPHLTGSDGRLEVQFTSVVAGTYTVNALIGADPIPEADQQITFVAGPISHEPGRTFLTGPASSAVADGQATQVVTATVADAHGNPVTGATVRFDVPAGAALAAGASAEVEVDGQGRAQLALVSFTAGTYEVTAAVRGGGEDAYQDITGGSPALATFVAGPVSPAHSVISSVPQGPLPADGITAFSVKAELMDQYGNRVETAGLPVAFTFELMQPDGTMPAPGVAPVTRSVLTDSAGVAATTFTTTRAGVWRATAQVGAATVAQGSPLQLRFNPLGAAAGASQFEVTPGNVLADGAASHAAWAIVKDVNGNPVPGAQVSFGVAAGAPGVPGPTLAPPDGVVTACDPTAPGQPTWCDQPGKAQVAITSQEPGSFNVTAAVGGATVAGAPQPVSFVAGSPDAAASSYVLDPDTAAAPQASIEASGNPDDAYTLTVQVKSASGILVPDARVRLVGLDTTKVHIVQAGGTGGATGAPASANYGTHTWNLYSATAGVYTATVQVNTTGNQWAPVAPDPVTLRFNAGAGAAVESWLVQPDGSAVANGADQLQVKAHIRDASGNNAGAGRVVFTVPPGLTATVAGTDTAGGPMPTVDAPISGGYATVLYKSTAAGEYPVSAKLDGDDISVVKDARESATLATSGRALLAFTAGPAASDKSVLTVPTAAGGATKVADGRQTHRAEVRVEDAFGNPVAGAQVFFRYGPDEARLTELAVAADREGLAAVDFASTQAAAFQVRAYLAGAEVTGSPATARFVAGPLDLARTLASFEVQDSVAPATGAHPLWVRMKAQDAQGNALSGVALGFKLTGAGDGPVFTPLADGRKEVDGESGPDGYLTADVVSEFEGAFPVVGVFGASQTDPKDLVFTSDTAEPTTSWFTVDRNPANAGNPATADGRDSYRVTVNLRSVDGHPLNGVRAIVKVTDPATGRVLQYPVTSGRLDGQSGTAVHEVTSTQAGSFNVTVELGGDQLSLGQAGASAKSAQVVFNPGPPDALTSRLIGPRTGPAKADYREQQIITAELRDAQSNPLAGASVAFAIPANVTAVEEATRLETPGPVTVAVHADASGQARLVLASKVVGVYDVTATVGAMAITEGSPAKAVFVNAAVSAGRSLFAIPTANQVMPVRTGFHTPTVRLFDASGNPYTAASVPVTFNWRPQGAGVWSGSKVVESTGGTAQWTDWTVAVAGVYEVQATIPSGQVGEVLAARFGPGPAVPAGSVFTSSAGTKVANDGSSAHFAQVLVQDAVTGGNPVEGEPVTFKVGGSARIAGAPGDGQTVTVASSAAGLARIDISDTAVESVQVTAEVGGVQVGSAELEFGPGAPSAAQSSWTVTPTTALGADHPAVAADGLDSWQAVVTVRDAGNLAVGGAEVQFEVPGAVAIQPRGPHTTDQSGRVGVTFTAKAAGSYQVRAMIGAAAVAPDRQTIEFAAGPIAPDVSYLEGPGVTAVADGRDQLPVRAYILDAQGNPVPGARVAFALPADLEAASSNTGDGTFSDPATLENGDGPVAAPDGIGDGDGPSSAAEVAPTEVVVQADPQTGLAEVAVTATKAGVYQVTAKSQLEGAAAWTPIEKGSPAVAQFVAGPISPSGSLITATPKAPLQLGVGGATYQVSVQLRDQRGNPVKQADVPIQYRFFPSGDTSDPAAFCTQAPDQDTRFASALTDAAGTATVPFASTKAGPWHGCGFYAGDQIVGGSPVDLTLTAGAMDLVKSDFEVSQNLVLADGQASHYGQVVIRDSFGNPLGGRAVTFQIGAGAPGVPGPNVKGQQTGTVTVTTCDPASGANAPEWCFDGGVLQAGLAMAHFTSEEPGTFPVSATAGGAPVDGSPKPVSFTAGPASAADSAWAIDPDTADPATGADVSLPASGQPADSYTLTVTARSAAGLLVPGARVRLAGLPTSVKIADDAVEGLTGAPSSSAFGRFSWRLYSSVAGTFTGRVQVWEADGWADVGVPFTVRFGAAAPDPDASWLAQPAGAAVADGVAELPVAAELRDANGNPVSGAEVVFHLPAGLAVACGTDQDAVAGPGSVVATAVAGAATCRFTSLRAGRYVVTAALAGPPERPLLTVKDAAGSTTLGTDGKVALTFVAGTPSGAASELAIPTGAEPKRAGEEQHVATVTVRDAAGNAVEGAPVVFQWARGSATAPGAGPWTTSEAQRSGPDGQASVPFGAPGDKAGWVWVRAFVEVDGVPQAVGGPQADPDYGQSVKRAEFVAGPVDPARTAASFETFRPAVPANLTDQSWARVVVQDRFGNGVPGAKVSFTVPAAQPGTAGTPVFADGSRPPEAKELTVASCPAQAAGGAEPQGGGAVGRAQNQGAAAEAAGAPGLSSPTDVAAAAGSAGDAANVSAAPANCLKDGVYTPGLAYAPIVSAFAGTFPVSATVAAGALTVDLSPGDVAFAAGDQAGSAAASSFTLLRTDSTAAVVTADGADSYTLTATVMNGQTGAAAAPVAGACVTPQLPAGMSVVSPAEPGGSCPVGSYATGDDGRVAIQVTSTVAGWALVGANLGGSPIPTEPGGHRHARTALFVGGPPDASRSELTSPPAPARADDPAGQTVTATLRDANGNLASCWSGGRQLPCPVALSVPAGTWVGEGSGQVTGPAVVHAAASLVDYGPAPSGDGAGGEIAAPASGGVATAVYRGAEGRYDVTGVVGDKPVGIADGVVAPDETARARIAFTDSTPPSPARPDPTDGGRLTGQVAAEDSAAAAAGELSVTVEDSQGRPLANCPVGRDGRFDCGLTPKQPEGAIVTVTVTDAAGNSTGVKWRVGQPQVNLSLGTLCGAARQAATGRNFQPGEDVTATTGDGALLGTAKADADGRVELAWTTPADSPNGQQTVVLTGPLSGRHSAGYKVDCPGPPVSPSPSASPTSPGSPSASSAPGWAASQAPTAGPGHTVPPAQPPGARPPGGLPFTGPAAIGLGLVACALILAGGAAGAAARRRLRAQ